MTITELRVHMDCGGCESKVRKYLQRLEGVDEIDIDMGMQKVTVTGHADQKKVLKAVRKTGRRAELWPFPPHYHQNLQQQQQHHHNRGIEPIHHISYAAPSSHYNYYKHGYDSRPEYEHYHQQAGTVSIFSDDNPNACSVM